MGSASDDAVRATRLDVVERRFPAWLREAGHDARSAMLAIVLSRWHPDVDYDDEGTVNLKVYASTDDEPTWPPRSGGVDWQSGLPDDELRAAFEPWCENPAYSAGHQLRLLAIAHVDRGVRFVGHQVRPWLDLPRTLAEPRPLTNRARHLLAVYREDPPTLLALGDTLAEAGDPRGELIAGASSEPGSCGRSWLGSFDQVVPRGELRFERGVPVEIGLWLPDHRPHLMPDTPGYQPWRRDDELPWLLGPRVRFLPYSAVHVWPALAPVRALGPLDDAALAEMAHAKTSFAVEELEVRWSGEDTLELLFAAAEHAPRLRVVRFIGRLARRVIAERVAPKLRAWPRLARLARLEIAQWQTSESHVAEATAWRGFPIPVRVTDYDDETERASGWSVELDGDQRRVERAGYMRLDQSKDRAT